jgi:hypothetical protein
MQLLQAGSCEYRNWLYLYDLDEERKGTEGAGWGRAANPLYYMVFSGICTLARALIDAGADVNVRGGFCYTR